MQSLRHDIPTMPMSSLIARYFHCHNSRLLNDIASDGPEFRPLNEINPNILKQANEYLNAQTVPLLSDELRLLKMHREPFVRVTIKRKPLFDGQPLCKGVVLRTVIKKPRKPNSANRKCVLLRLSTGKEMVAYVPGEGHNLQEHNVVLCKIARLRDTPGVKIKCIRGAYDLPHVVKKKNV